MFKVYALGFFIGRIGIKRARGVMDALVKWQVHLAHGLQGAGVTEDPHSCPHHTVRCSVGSSGFAHGKFPASQGAGLLCGLGGKGPAMLWSGSLLC